MAVAWSSSPGTTGLVTIRHQGFGSPSGNSDPDQTIGAGGPPEAPSGFPRHGGSVCQISSRWTGTDESTSKPSRTLLPLSSRTVTLSRLEANGPPTTTDSSLFLDRPTWRNLPAQDVFSIPLPFQASADMPLASKNTCTTVPVVKTCTTVPVVVSISALASRTSTPVIRLISCRSVSAESLNNWR